MEISAGNGQCFESTEKPQNIVAKRLETLLLVDRTRKGLENSMIASARRAIDLSYFFIVYHQMRCS
jgi:hypothetical protein